MGNKEMNLSQQWIWAIKKDESVRWLVIYMVFALTLTTSDVFFSDVPEDAECIKTMNRLGVCHEETIRQLKECGVYDADLIKGGCDTRK